MARKQANDVYGGAEKQAQALRGATLDIPLPEGLYLDGEDEKVLWRQFTGARAPKDWRRLDLVLVHKAIKLETRLKEMWEELDRIGYLLENARGTVTANPMAGIIHQVQNQQLAIIRTLQLTELPLGDAKLRQRDAKQAQAAGEALGGQGEDVMDLLAHTDPNTGETLYEPQ